jgi:hypothetical protein
LVTGAVVDSGIALVLLWEFRKASGTLTEAKGCAIWQILYQLCGSGIISILDRVIIQSGAAAATLAGAALIS